MSRSRFLFFGGYYGRFGGLDLDVFSFRIRDIFVRLVNN